ncbi:MAG TPA: FAD-dependent oxidoreductase [Pyrinomonadaceae bacterium]|nr:FAD-dependent oxidoreductase [Pyrinomonadaceae bacterium]
MTESNQTCDVAVVGAGVFGAWAAFELQRSGKQVILIDAYGPANSRASSGDETRIMRVGYGADEVYTRSALHSLARWKEISRDHDEALFYQTGVLWLAQAADPYPLSTRATLSRVGIPFEQLEISEVARRYPQIGLENISWAMLEPESGVLLARRGVQTVCRAAIKQGVEFLPDAVMPPGTDASRDAGGRLTQITTANGRQISAAAFVFACGPWLPKIFPEVLGNRVQPTRQEVFYFGAPAGDWRFAAPALPVWIDFKDEAYGLPDVEGRGVKVAIDRHGQPFDPDTGDRVVTSEGLAEARRCLARRLPRLKDAPVIEARVCQYENTSNGDFLIDRHPEFENVWLVGGGSGHGFKHGPAVGEYVAARIEGNSVGMEPRFSLKSKGTAHQRAVY